MRYRHRFIVPAPLHIVAAFHRRADSLSAITPPLMPMQLQHAPSRLEAGDEIAFTLWLGPLPVRWRVRIEQMLSDSFTDRMIEGPFRSWRHRHSFRAMDNGTTEVLDEIEYALRPHPLWGLVGLAMAIGLPLLFFFRAQKTVHLIIREQDTRTKGGVESS